MSKIWLRKSIDEFIIIMCANLQGSELKSMYSWGEDYCSVSALAWILWISYSIVSWNIKTNFSVGRKSIWFYYIIYWEKHIKPTPCWLHQTYVCIVHYLHKLIYMQDKYLTRYVKIERIKKNLLEEKLIYIYRLSLTYKIV